ITKPHSLTSAQVVRDIQTAFNSSRLYAPWLATEKASRDKLNSFQRRRRRDKRLDVKVGHGGTLDPLATGVLIIGVGKGTKNLSSFLNCTKTYETVLLFGGATDTYDILGKTVKRAPYGHVTQHLVDAHLPAFRGHIMQRPPIYSALRIQGKRLYEYAREGKELPIEIQERSVRVDGLEIVKWMSGDEHKFDLPQESVALEERGMAEDVLQLAQSTISTSLPADQVSATDRADSVSKPIGSKRKLELPSAELERKNKARRSGDLFPDSESHISIGLDEPMNADQPDPNQMSISQKNNQITEARAPAILLRMTVSSGFYVRSLCHDLGQAVGSLGTMAKLSRTRQGAFELGKNVLDYEMLAKGEETWGPVLLDMLSDWNDTNNKGRNQPPTSHSPSVHQRYIHDMSKAPGKGEFPLD
ncbi:hypothetical protein MMC25_008352, partial [Agyrium rufum]|nr:hypothetical protein [Agyrium rufum]